MREAFVWAVLVVFGILAVVRGLRFRRGAITSMLNVYRDHTKPRVYRNLPVAAPAIGVLALGWLLLASPFFVGTVVPLRIVGELAGFWRVLVPASLLVLFAASVGLLAFPPRWLHPPWLVTDIAKMSLGTPELQWFDRALIVIAGANLFIGLVAIAYLATADG